MKCAKCKGDEMVIISYAEAGHAIVCQECDHHVTTHEIRLKPADMTTGQQWKFRIGDLSNLATILDESALNSSISGVANLHSAIRAVKRLSAQALIQTHLKDSDISKDTSLYLHTMTYDELRLAWLRLTSAAATIAEAMNWISIGEKSE